MHPVPQSVQYAGEVAPAAEYGAEAGHSVQPTAGAPLYVPGGHAPPAVGLVDPGGQMKPAVHTPVQVETPMPALTPYRPRGQGLQEEAPARLYRPAGQMVTVELVLPPGHVYPGEHSPLQAGDESWVALPNVPGGQLTQTAAPPRL